MHIVAAPFCMRKVSALSFRQAVVRYVRRFVFASPSAEDMYEVDKAAHSGAGVLHLYGRYGGDIMNFGMAKDLCEMDDIEVREVLVTDDVASAPKGSEDKRRGVAGLVFAYKIAGAAAERMLLMRRWRRCLHGFWRIFPLPPAIWSPFWSMDLVQRQRKSSTSPIGKRRLFCARRGFLFIGAVAGVMERGKSKPGDKTMLDALYPAVEALGAAAAAGDSLTDAWQKAYEAAKDGMEKTTSMQSVHGRAAYYQEKSVGRQDPGATAMMYIVSGIAKAVR